MLTAPYAMGARRKESCMAEATTVFQIDSLFVFQIDPLFVFQNDSVFVFQNDPPAFAGSIFIPTCCCCVSTEVWTHLSFTEVTSEQISNMTLYWERYHSGVFEKSLKSAVHPHSLLYVKIFVAWGQCGRSSTCSTLQFQPGRSLISQGARWTCSWSRKFIKTRKGRRTSVFSRKKNTSCFGVFGLTRITTHLQSVHIYCAFLHLFERVALN